MRLLLVMMSTYMSDGRDVIWCKPDTLAEDTGLALSTVEALLKEAQAAGLVERWQGDHRAKDMRIVWPAVAAYEGKATKRGGRKTPNTGGHTPNTGDIPPITGDQLPPDNRGSGPRSSVDCPPNIGGLPPEHRARSDQGTDQGTDQEPTNARARVSEPASPPPVAPPVADPTPKPDPAEVRLYGVLRGYQPRRAATPTADARKALRRLLAESGTYDRACCYLAWVHTSRDEWAMQLRGDAPWPGGSVQARWSPEELARSLGGRLDRADAWDAAGRPTTHATGGSAAPDAIPRRRTPAQQREYDFELSIQRLASGDFR